MAYKKGILLLLLFVSPYSHCASIAEPNPVATMQVATGSWSFLEIGTLYSESSSQLVSFTVNVPDYLYQGQQYQASVRAAVSNNSFLYTDEVQNIQEFLLPAEIRSMDSYAKYSEDNPKSKRSFLDVFLPISGLVFGIGNTFIGLSNTGRINSLEEQNEAIIKAVDQQKEVIASNAKNVRVIGDEVDNLNSSIFVAHVIRGFDHLKRVFDVAKSVMGHAIHHQLSPAASELWNMEEVYQKVEEELVKSGRRPAFSQWQSMLSMPVNWYGSPSGDFHIVLQIPTVPVAVKQPMTLFQSIPGPLYVNETFIQFTARDDFIAQNPVTGELSSLSKVEVEQGCTRVGHQFYCHSPLVKSQNGNFSTCLTSLFNKDFSQVARQCIAHAMPLVDSVFPASNNSFFILAKQPDNVFVHCNGGALTKTLRIRKGLSKMSIRSGCRAQSTNWRTTAGTPKSLKKTIEFTQSNLAQLANTGGSLDPPSKLNLVETPRELPSVRDYLEGQKWTQKDYLLIALVACLAVVICVLIGGALVLYLMWKRIQKKQHPQE